MLLASPLDSCAMLGSTVVTRSCVSLRRMWGILHVFYVKVVSGPEFDSRLVPQSRDFILWRLPRSVRVVCLLAATCGTKLVTSLPFVTACEVHGLLESWGRARRGVKALTNGCQKRANLSINGQIARMTS